MGRHSSNEQVRYYQSVAGWVLPWALVGVVALTAVWIAVGALGRDLETPPPSGSTAQGPNEPAETATSPEPSPSPTEAQGSGVSQPDDSEPKKDEPADKPELITDGISVQVLNGTSSNAAGLAMTARLSRLGFDVVVSFPSTPYDDTTVLWSNRRGKRAAKALAARFSWRAAPKPANLSPSVDIHVVVGADEA